MRQVAIAANCCMQGDAVRDQAVTATGRWRISKIIGGKRGRTVRGRCPGVGAPETRRFVQLQRAV